MGKPSAALVATALWMATLHQTMKGTEMKAPPAPTRPATMPIRPPTAVAPRRPGIWRPGLGLRSISIWVAEKPTKTANSTPSAWPLISANRPAPDSRPPATIPGASSCTRSQRTAPRAWWARTLLMEVNRMVAMAVATAIFSARPASTPRLLKITVRKGTISMPPPMPSRPARKPVQQPRSNNSRTSVGSSSAIRSPRQAVAAQHPIRAGSRA